MKLTAQRLGALAFFLSGMFFGWGIDDLCYGNSSSYVGAAGVTFMLACWINAAPSSK
jgi:hypothetical protein